MEEIVAATLVFILLMSVAILAFAYTLPTINTYIRFSEVTAATSYLKRISQTSANLMMGDAGTSVIRFSFIYGVLSVNSTGTTSVCYSTSPNGQCDSHLYQPVPHFVFSYVSSATGFPPSHVLDRGTTERAAYVDQTPLDAALVYHYTSSGRTYVVADQKVLFSVISNGQQGTVVHIYILNVQPVPNLAVKTGALSLIVNSTSTTITQIQSSSATFRVQCGVDGSGAALVNSIPVTSSNGQIAVYLNVLTLAVVQG